MHLKTAAAPLVFNALAVYYVLQIALHLPQMLRDIGRVLRLNSATVTGPCQCMEFYFVRFTKLQM